MQTKRQHPNDRGSRQRLLASADRLLRRNGYAGSPLSAIAAEGRAPMGSVYFHFPGGKEQLAAEAMRYGSQGVVTGLKRALESSADPAVALARCAKAWADDLERSDWEDGCPVAATALQVSTTSERLRVASAEIMEGWATLIRDHLKRHGCTEREADIAAELALSLLEGAELMAR